MRMFRLRIPLVFKIISPEMVVQSVSRNHPKTQGVFEFLTLSYCGILNVILAVDLKCEHMDILS